MCIHTILNIRILDGEKAMMYLPGNLRLRQIKQRYAISYIMQTSTVKETAHQILKNFD
jgi:hypothetical protein